MNQNAFNVGFISFDMIYKYVFLWTDPVLRLICLALNYKEMFVLNLQLIAGVHTTATGNQDNINKSYTAHIISSFHAFALLYSGVEVDY